MAILMSALIFDSSGGAVSDEENRRPKAVLRRRHDEQIEERNLLEGRSIEATMSSVTSVYLLLDLCAGKRCEVRTREAVCLQLSTKCLGTVAIPQARLPQSANQKF